MTHKPLAIVVAHGAPSDPDPLDHSVKALARKVEDFASEWRIAGATLAKPGSLEAAIETADDGETINVLPFFMSAGWFVKTELRRRIPAATSADVSYLTPFGLYSRIPALCAQRAAAALARDGHEPETAILILAAHGSRRGHAAARAARAVATQVRGLAAFAEVRVGFVEQAPTIEEAATDLGASPAICLPLFATTAGHVLEDIPDQLSKAGFKGRTLAPIGDDTETPRVIAEMLLAGRSRKRPVPCTEASRTGE